MSRSTHFRLRWKGALTGPFTLSRVSELLRAGEISLLHNIEVDGHWMTVRDYFRSIGQGRASGSTGNEFIINPYQEAESEASPELAYGEAPSPENLRNVAGDMLERSVREGYLWCGSTFLFPPFLALAVYLLHVVSAEISPLSLFVLLCLTTSVGIVLPIVFVRKVGRILDAEGLSEIRQAQANLAALLAALGFCIWLVVFWGLVHNKS